MFLDGYVPCGYNFCNGKIRAVYEEGDCIDCLMEKENMDADEAVDFFEYNTIRGLGYCHTDNAIPPLMIRHYGYYMEDHYDEFETDPFLVGESENSKGDEIPVYKSGMRDDGLIEYRNGINSVENEEYIVINLLS